MAFGVALAAADSLAGAATEDVVTPDVLPPHPARAAARRVAVVMPIVVRMDVMASPPSGHIDAGQAGELVTALSSRWSGKQFGSGGVTVAPPPRLRHGRTRRRVVPAWRSCRWTPFAGSLECGALDLAGQRLPLPAHSRSHVSSVGVAVRADATLGRSAARRLRGNP